MKTGASSKPKVLAVAAIQSRCEPDIDYNTRRAVDLLAKAASAGATVALFPEAFLTGYDFDYADTLTPAAVEGALKIFRDACRLHNITGIVGTLSKRGRSGRLLNIAHVVNPQGQIYYEYAKIQLASAQENAKCRPGNKIALFSISGIPVTIIICRDGRHPELTSLATMAGAVVCFQLANNIDSIEASWWKLHAGRATQPIGPRTGIFHVCANAVGQSPEGTQMTLGGSFIKDPSGLSLAEAGLFEESIIVANLALDRATRGYILDSMKRPQFLSAEWTRMVDLVIARKDDPVE